MHTVTELDSSKGSLGARHQMAIRRAAQREVTSAVEPSGQALELTIFISTIDIESTN
jgi:hypothetical protein